MLIWLIQRISVLKIITKLASSKLRFTAKLQDGKTIESWYINNKKLNKSSNVFLYKINPREANNKVIEISYKLKK